jgi:hypothetical protein
MVLARKILILIQVLTLSCSAFAAPMCRDVQLTTVVSARAFPDLPASERTEVVAKIENDAITALENMVRPNEESIKDVHQWLQNLQSKVAQGQPISIMEHTALTYLLDRKIFDSFPEPEVKTAVEQLLIQSWEAKTGFRLNPDELIQPLTPAVQAQMTREERVFHQVIFEPDGRLSQERKPSKRAIIAATLLTGFAFSRTGGDVISGTILGYMGATMAEHLIHKYGGHASNRIKAVTEKMGWIGAWFKKVSFRHGVVHHGLTYRKDYATQFRDEQEMSDLNDKLEERFGFTKTELDQLAESKYGASLSTRGVLQGLMSTAPVYLAMSHLMGFGPMATAAMIAPTAAYLALSKCIHPYMHMTRTEVNTSAPRFVRWVLTSRYGEWMSRHHYIHHKGGGGNYNLLHIGIGGDSLTGELRNPTLQQVLEMRRLDLIGAAWD